MCEEGPKTAEKEDSAEDTAEAFEENPQNDLEDSTSQTAPTATLNEIRTIETADSSDINIIESCDLDKAKSLEQQSSIAAIDDEAFTRNDDSKQR